MRYASSSLEYPALPERPRGEIVAAIDRQTAAENGWTFVMLSPSQNKAVQRWLVENSKRPQKATLLWAELFDHLRRDTGEIMLTRDELAEAHRRATRTTCQRDHARAGSPSAPSSSAASGWPACVAQAGPSTS